MKFRKLILYSFLLLVLLFSVAAISASDLNGTDDVGGDILKDSKVESYNNLSDEIMPQNSSFSLEKDYILKTPLKQQLELKDEGN